MKNIKLNSLQFLILLITISFNLISCSTDEQQTSIEESKAVNLNTLENRKSVSDIFTKGTKSNAFLESYILNANKEIGFDNSSQDIESAINDYLNCSYCSDEYKDFMIPFIKDVVKTNDSELLDLINNYQSKIESYNADYITKQNLDFVLFSFNKAASYNLTKFETLNEKTTYNKVATGLAWGFLAGCATGAYVGGTAGTVTVPIIGTVTGAVAGCIAGGAWSATVGAAGGAFWEIFD